MMLNPNDLAKLPLRSARPTDQAHLLLWDNPDAASLQFLASHNCAHLVSYREHLCQRIPAGDRTLNLHEELDRELDALRTICAESPRQMVILQDCDRLIAYLRCKRGNYERLFWSSLANTRKLSTLLWLVLPSALAPKDPKLWSETRIEEIRAL
jgi:hypothetical protein